MKHCITNPKPFQNPKFPRCDGNSLFVLYIFSTDSTDKNRGFPVLFLKNEFLPRYTSYAQHLNPGREGPIQSKLTQAAKKFCDCRAKLTHRYSNEVAVPYRSINSTFSTTRAPKIPTFLTVVDGAATVSDVLSVGR